MQKSAQRHTKKRAYKNNYKIKKEKRRPWTIKEDEMMSKIVEENGTKYWTLISYKLNQACPDIKRSSKQCRERWHNHLNAGINKDRWSFEEELVLFTQHDKVGNKWAEISGFIKGRTDNSIKNHFYSTLRKVYRSIKGMDGSKEQLKKYSPQLAAIVFNRLKRRQKLREETEKGRNQDGANDCLSSMPFAQQDFEDKTCYDLTQNMNIDLNKDDRVEFSWSETGISEDEVWM
ncbi:hypothetical protein SteCoe_18386 [Stentor coeruleus]|uniref:Myb-like DNA-binding domain containing protein n=1 Tax=Stentor coeruleus TaxID=5963 RepID=A0A1R2BWM1_9CILI|nr:hypothetical protein SteCoe_18386 [Stentor coeruleus]